MTAAAVVPSQKALLTSLSDVLPVMNYLRRVGAEVRSFRHASVTTEGGRYPKHLATIRFMADGSVLAPADYAPTDAEAQMIAEALASYRMPQITPPLATHSLPDALRSTPAERLFEFRDAEGRIAMIQQRVERDDGRKEYRPWTYWEGVGWQCMEPDGPLPIWGLEQLKDNSVVWLHEGAKAARAVRQMLDDPAALAAHPWGDAFKHVAHLGWIGGAPNADRTDWSVLSRAGVTRAYVICDRDQEGEDAASVISRALRMPVEALMFDSRFTPGFDLADEFPAALFDTKKGVRRYVGPLFSDCLMPATWATDLLPNPAGTGRPITVLRDHFVSQWRYVDGVEAFINVNHPGRLRGREAFNNAVRAFSDVKDTAEHLLKKPSIKVDDLAYLPGRKAGVVTMDGRRRFNVCQPTTVQPKRGDVGPFLDYLAHLFPVERERHEVMRWCATLIARPDIRMGYALILASETQGVGKSTLGHAILKPLMGPGNTSVPNEHSVTESAFNGYVVNKRLVLMDEIYAGSTTKPYNKLKGLITDDTIEVNIKFQPTYEIENWTHFIACSNSLRPLKVEDTDRRWFVPKVTEGLKPRTYWTDLRDWLAGDGLSIIKQWADDFVAQHGPVAAGDVAPTSAAKEELIVASMSEGERLIHDLAVNVMERAPERVVLTVPQVRGWLAARRDMRLSDARLEKPDTIAKALRRAGLTVWTNNDRVKVGGERVAVALNWSETPGASTWAADLKPHQRTIADAWPTGLGLCQEDF